MARWRARRKERWAAHGTAHYKSGVAGLALEAHGEKEDAEAEE